LAKLIDDSGLRGLNDPHSPPSAYKRAPQYERIVPERNVAVPMRDGVRLVVDVYRPDAAERFPALLSFAVYNKELQGPELGEDIPPQPAWSTLWAGPLEAGDTRFLVSRGYAHVIGTPRGVGASDGGGSREWDSHDLIEWIAEQPWCDGNVGMIGISGFGAEQLAAAKTQPPHLKAIFPFDPRGAYGYLGGFRDEYPGGVVHVFRYLLGHFSAVHLTKGKPAPLPPEKEGQWEAARHNSDYRMYPHIFNVLAQKGQHMPQVFELLINPFEAPGVADQSEAEFGKVRVPVYTGSGWYAYTYKTHLNGAQNWFRHVETPKRLLFVGPGHLERPFHSLHSEILRWNDHWLKGLDTGIMREAPVRYWVMGENAWRTGQDWPLPETRWTKLYLDSWERLRPESPLPASAKALQMPDAFVQMPPTLTNRISGLRYMTDPLSEDVLVAGPISLSLFASIDQEDTNWIVVLKDVGPDVSVMTAREGERAVPEGLPERELTRGWLKATNRALDPDRSAPWKPWHRLTRDAARPVPPGEIVEYKIEIMATANLFRRGHRICLDITSMDFPTGVAGATNAEYIPYHICSSQTTLHKIFHDAARPSHLLLPIVPLSRGEEAAQDSIGVSAGRQNG
jgi:putative CocE/NonD family hydrolase